MKKKICLFLALAAALSLLTSMACAEEVQRFSVDNYSCVLLEDGTAEIVKYSGSDEEVVIPTELDGKTVTAIGDKAFDGRKYLQSVTIPETVSSVGVNPFTNCSALTKITVPKGHPYLATIYGVLYSKADKRLVCCPDNYSASEYEIPEGIKIIGDYAFYNCESLNKITIPDSVTVIGKSAFQNCHLLKNLSIPNSVTEIGKSAFSGLIYLEKITIPGSVKEIPENAFAYCGNLTEALIEEGVQKLGDQVFYSCDDLKKITIPDSVTEVGTNPFSDCDKLTEIILSQDHPFLTVQDGVLFTKPEHRLVFYPTQRSDTEYTVPEGTEIIGAYAFSRAYNLTDVRLPASVRSIEPYAFLYCYITSVTLPDGFVTLGPSAFEGCSQLTQVILPDTLMEIGSSSFASCSKLTEITIPDSVTAIGEMAFYQCSSLREAVIPDGVTSIGPNAFDKCSSNLTLTVGWGSYAEEYCKGEYYKYTYAPIDDDLSWLND